MWKYARSSLAYLSFYDSQDGYGSRHYLAERAYGLLPVGYRRGQVMLNQNPKKNQHSHHHPHSTAYES